MKRFVLGQFGARLQSPVAVTLRKSQKRETAAVNTVSPCDARLLQPWTGNTWLAPSMKLWSYLPRLRVRLGSQHPSRGVSDHPNFTDGRIKSLVSEIMCVVKGLSESQNHRMVGVGRAL